MPDCSGKFCGAVDGCNGRGELEGRAALRGVRERVRDLGEEVFVAVFLEQRVPLFHHRGELVDVGLFAQELPEGFDNAVVLFLRQVVVGGGQRTTSTSSARSTS